MLGLGMQICGLFLLDFLVKIMPNIIEIGPAINKL